MGSLSDDGAFCVYLSHTTGPEYGKCFVLRTWAPTPLCNADAVRFNAVPEPFVPIPCLALSLPFFLPMDVVARLNACASRDVHMRVHVHMHASCLRPASATQ